MNKTNKCKIYFKYHDNNNFRVTTRNYSRRAIRIFKEFSWRPIDNKAKTWVFPLFHYNTVFEKLSRCNDLHIIDSIKPSTIEYFKKKALDETESIKTDTAVF